MKYGEPNIPALVGNMTVSELKTLIKECLREFEEEKYRGIEEQYKAVWKKPPTNSPFYRHDHVINYDDPYKGKKRK